VTTVIDRLGTDDLVQLAADVGPVREQVGAVLLLDGPADAAALADLVANRLGSVPRLRQVVRRTPPGCGRPVWVDDPGFDASAHVRVLACRSPGDEHALLEAALGVLTAPLPPQRPPWRAAVLTGLAGGRVAVVVALHHVLTDGIGGLAVLARLADRGDGRPEPDPEDVPVPRPAPTAGELAREVWGRRWRAVRRLPSAARTLRTGLAEMRRLGRARASASSLNRRTGRRRSAVVARVPLDDVRATAHECGATVNDVVLAAVAGALRELVRRRGEPLPDMVASVPVARRAATSTDDLGNALGGMTVPLSVDVDRRRRLVRTAATTTERKDATGAAFGALVGPAFRLMGALHVVEPYIDRQRMVTAFVTGLAGPTRPLHIGGSPVGDIVPLSHLTGNVTVTFAALSYAGTLVLSVTADPEACPDLDALKCLLQEELDAYASLPVRLASKS
jgi:diacylglycerol O-acyltransferase / wax synthase